MAKLDDIGTDWLVEQIDAMPDSIDRVTPVKYNEENRFIPAGVSPRPGYIRYDLFPYLAEIVDCFDPISPVREVNFMKGVQVGYTTLLESVLFYYIGHIKTAPVMYLTADKELATGRVENNILPMINESDLGHLIRSSDEGNTRKTGKTKNFIQWDGGGFLIYNGALNAAKMRQYSVPLMLKDELDGWKMNVGVDGNSDTLTDARLSAYWPIRKILRGSTPLVEPSMINEAYLKGDQRQYLILCRSCSFPQRLRMEHIDKETGLVGGFRWETEEGVLLLDSVRYYCIKCGHGHSEYDKEYIFSADNGAYWEPTATPREPGIRSYHLPSFYSPFGFRPWSKCISDYLDAYDPVEKKTLSVSKYQEFYNNTLGVPFKIFGARIRYDSVSGHRRTGYKFGQIPNKYAVEHSGSHVMLLVCTIDVHKSNLAVSVVAFCRDMRSYVIDYWRFEDEDCTQLSSPVWGRVKKLIEETPYTADDGKIYRIAITLIDAGYANDTINTFSSEYESGVYPILGRERAAKNQTIKEFGEFTTQLGTVGYRILVDHYKDRLAPVLRREWLEEEGEQGKYHFNAPVDITRKQLEELTVETRRKKTFENGFVTYVWYRPGNVRNELWDLLVYAHAAVEILAFNICIQHFELKTVDWPTFWDYVEEDKLFYTEDHDTNHP